MKPHTKALAVLPGGHLGLPRTAHFYCDCHAVWKEQIIFIYNGGHLHMSRLSSLYCSARAEVDSNSCLDLLKISRCVRTSFANGEVSREISDYWINILF